MPTPVVANGAWIIPETGGNQILVVEATVGGVHHHAQFLADDVLRLPTTVQWLKRIAGQLKSLDAAAGSITQAPPGAPGTMIAINGGTQFAGPEDQP